MGTRQLAKMPALSAADVEHVDAVSRSHDQHPDNNLDRALRSAAGVSV
jgi:hypothetical protein